MGQNKNLEQFLIKKAYEICYALFRVTARVKRESFARRLEEAALDLLESASSGDHKKSLAGIESLDRLIGFGADIGFVYQSNADTIRRELNDLNSAIADIPDSATAEEVSLKDIFSNGLFAGAADVSQRVVAEATAGTPTACREVAGGKDPNGSGNSDGNGNGNHNIVKTAMRQSAILERIRQNGNCRLKELQEILPAVSERTIRYDLQRLLAQGIVERIGNGGPATHYIIRE